MTLLRYADPRLWAQGGLSVPLKPGATYHLDDNGPPGLEVRFDNASAPMPLGPGATFRVPDGGGLCSFRMGMWRRGAPDFNASIVTNMAPQAGTTPEAYFLRNAQFSIRDGWYSGPNGLLPGDGPMFVHAFDGTQKVIPLLAFFTAAQLARAKSLVIDYGARGVGSIDVAPVPLTQPVVSFYMRRAGADGTGIAWSDQRKRWGAALDETAYTCRLLFSPLRFVMSGPFSPFDCVHVEDYAGGAATAGASFARFRLGLSESYVDESVTCELVAGATPITVVSPDIANVLICIDSDRLRSTRSTVSVGTVGTSVRFVGLDDTGNIAAAGYGRWTLTGGAATSRSCLGGNTYQGRTGLYLNATAANVVIRGCALSYTESGADLVGTT